jgi:hypothetical protein
MLPILLLGATGNKLVESLTTQPRATSLMVKVAVLFRRLLPGDHVA